MKAYGFLGSTTTAYGPFSGNDQADIICQIFLRRVLEGASLGRAALEARQRLVERTSPLSPMNQKTLAQFNLYGDPAVVPVATATSTLVVAPKVTPLSLAAKSLGKSKSMVATNAVKMAGAVERAERRETLRAKGDFLAGIQPNMSKAEKITKSGVKSSMTKLMSQLNLTPLKDSFSFNVQDKPTTSLVAKNPMAKGISKAVADKKQGTTAFHVMFGIPAGAATKAVAKGGAPKSIGFAATASKSAAKSAKKSPIRKFVVLEAKEVDGKIVSVKEAHTK
jgi:hypothetical protein